MAEDKVNAGIILALETAPQPEIPADFAAKVARLLPPRGAVVLTPGRYGRRAAAACLMALPVLMLAFAHRATGTSLYWLSIESILSAESALLAVWLAARGYTSTSSS
jgi:hypothetical protein